MLGWSQIPSSSLVFLVCPPSVAVPLVAVLAFASNLSVHTSLLPWLLVLGPLFWYLGVFCPYMCHLQGLSTKCYRA